MIKTIVNLIKALGANTNPGEIAHAMSCGLLLGLMPKNNLLWWLVFIFVLFIRINKPAYAILILFGAAISPAFDGLFDSVGYCFLTLPSLSGLFATLFDIPFLAFTRFNNSVVMGSLLCGIIAYIPVYILSRCIIAVWRKYAVPIIRQSKLMKVISQLPLISKIVGMAGGN